MMVPERVKSELKRFLNAKQVQELSRQLDTYEKRVREAVKQFDVKGREARKSGQEQLDKFAVQVKKTGQELERQLKTFMNQEGKTLNKGLNELFTYFKSIRQSETPKVKTAAKKVAKKAATKASKARTTARKVAGKAVKKTRSAASARA